MACLVGESMNIKQEFEKAFEDEFGRTVYKQKLADMLWAAKWMAERIVKEFELNHSQFHQTLHTETIISEIRELVKELS